MKTRYLRTIPPPYNLDNSSLIMRLSFIMLFLTINLITFSQIAPTWEWAKEASGSNDDKAYGLDIDSQGNILMSGNFKSNISFNNISLNSSSTSYPDFYVAKYNPMGDAIWVKRGIGAREDMAYDVVTDENDNVIVTGVYGMFSTNSLTIDSVTLSNSGKGDMFLAKYDSNGNLLWALREGGAAREWGRSVDVDLQGNIYVCGNFVDGNTNIGGNAITNAGSYGFFICKYDSNGNLIWYKIGNSPLTNLIRNIVVYPETGNIYAFGDFRYDSLSLDNITVYNHNSGELDNFLYKLDTDGNTLWGRCIGGTEREKGNFCTIDVRENVYVTGIYESSECYIGNDTLTNNNINQGDTYIAMYSYLGDYEWSVAITGNDQEIAYSITSDTSDYVFVTGYFNSSTLNIGGQSFSNNGSYDIFVTKYDYQGDFHWATTVGGSGSDKANVITINHNRELFIAGEFTSSSVQFDSTTIYHTSYEDIFLAKLKDYCEMPDVSLGNDTMLYADDELIIDVPGYQDYYWGNGLTGTNVSILGSDYNTGYLPVSLTVTDSSGCVSADVILITICNYPNQFLGEDTTIFNTEQIILDADIGYDDFLWNTGEITPSIEVIASMMGIGEFEYWVETSDQFGCIGSDTITINIIPNISIDELLNNDILVFPVPADDMVNLIIKDIDKINKIVLFTSNGQKLRSLDIENQSEKISISTKDLKNGIYIIQIESGNDIKIVKLIVEH